MTFTQPQSSSRAWERKYEATCKALKAALRAKGIRVRRKSHGPAFERGAAAKLGQEGRQ